MFFDNFAWYLHFLPEMTVFSPKNDVFGQQKMILKKFADFRTNLYIHLAYETNSLILDGFGDF